MNPFLPADFYLRQMAKLTTTQKNQIIIEAAEGITIQEQVRKYGVSYTTIKRVRRSDPPLNEAAEKRVIATRDSIIEHMEKLRPEINTLLDEYIQELHDPEKRKNATLVQLATTMGILIDKFTAHERSKVSDEDVNNLFEALEKVSPEEDIDGVPELQPQAAAVYAVVEDQRA